jgi:hypothetical protein
VVFLWQPWYLFPVNPTISWEGHSRRCCGWIDIGYMAQGQNNTKKKFHWQLNQGMIERRLLVHAAI